MEGRRHKAHELRRQVEWALARAVDPGAVLPLLHRLARLAAEGSEERSFAHLHLAELLVERDPWRAALFARRVLARRPEDDRAWATLAFSQTMLGHYRFAAAAYRRAIATAPQNPCYAHNLGHLLDVALDRPVDAVHWLRKAHESSDYSGEVASSFAHALARAGQLDEARTVLARAARRRSSREHAALLRWVEQGAPGELDHPLPRPARPAPQSFEGGATRGGRSAKRAPRPSALPELEEVLARGLASLPLDARQRMRAKSLARDAVTSFRRPPGPRGATAAQGVAAAIAYAIVYIDHVPLTQAEVAACFRVSVAILRGRFAELRAHLDLAPGDARYATLRRR